MQLSNFPIAEILLSLLSFILGIAATLLGQIVTRKLKFADARKKLRYENLKKIRTWIEAYRDILKCQYPQVNAFWFSQAIAPSLGMGIPAGEPKFENDVATSIIRDLKKYREAKEIVDKASEIGEEAFYALEVNNFGNGFIVEVLDHLRKFHTLFDFLYKSIEKNYAETEINWDKLDAVSPDTLHKIIVFAVLPTERRNLGYVTEEKYHEKYIGLVDALSSVDWKKRQASEHLDSIFAIIRKYESKWVVPDST